MIDEIVKSLPWLKEPSLPCREPYQRQCNGNGNGNVNGEYDICGNSFESDSAGLACIDSCCDTNKHDLALDLAFEQLEKMVVQTTPAIPNLLDALEDNQVEMSCRKKGSGSNKNNPNKIEVIESEEGQSFANSIAIAADSELVTLASTSIETIDTTQAAKSAEGASASKAASAAKPCTSKISLNKIDAEDALDRLVNDLSHDEISMVIDIFGEDYDSSTTKQNDFNLATEPHLVRQMMNSICTSIPMSRRAASLANSPHLDGSLSSVKWHPSNDEKELLTGATTRTHTSLPRSFFRHANSAIEHRGVNVNANEMKEVGDSLMHSIHRCYGPEVVRPMTPCPIVHDANSVVLQQHPASVASILVLGAPLSASLAKEQQMAHKRNTKDAESNGVSRICDCDYPSTSLPLLQKRGKIPPNVSYETGDVGVALSHSMATEAMRTIGVPAKSKETKDDIVEGDPAVKISSIETYIAPPRKPNEDLWNMRLKDASEFISKHDHSRIPTTYPPNPGLAKWAKRQRCHYKVYKKHVLDRPLNPAIVSTKALRRGKFGRNKPGIRLVKCLMTPERLEKLQAVGFCMDLQEENWEQNYKLLCEYAKLNNGRTHCSKHHNYDLWKWIGTQRYQMSLTKKRAMSKSSDSTRYTPCLSPDRIVKLNKIKFCWKEGDTVEERASIEKGN